MASERYGNWRRPYGHNRGLWESLRQGQPGHLVVYQDIPLLAHQAAIARPFIVNTDDGDRAPLLVLIPSINRVPPPPS
jgi:hypothetical protein